jgi:uncharacterized protein
MTLGTALITGASSGIGAVYADRLAKRGYDLILVARDQQRLANLAARLTRETGRKVETFRADLTDKRDLLAVETRLRTDTAITLLLNNAGIGSNGGLIDGDVDQMETMIQLNVLAVMRLAVAAVSAFVPRKTGTIINVASVLALVPEMLNGTYSGTKAFTLNLSQALHHEAAESGIRIHALLPGATRTEIWERTGRSIETIPSDMLMEVDEMVDAALVALDQGELVTIPSLADPTLWENFSAARLALGPHLSKTHAAARFRAAALTDA